MLARVLDFYVAIGYPAEIGRRRDAWVTVAWFLFVHDSPLDIGGHCGYDGVAVAVRRQCSRRGLGGAAVGVHDGTSGSRTFTSDTAAIVMVSKPLGYKYSSNARSLLHALS